MISEETRIIQVMPPGDWERAFVFSDGTLEREPLVGWGLVEAWVCPSSPQECLGRACVYADGHEQWGTEVRPLRFMEGTAHAGDFLRNDAVVPKGLSDEDARAWVEAAHS